MANRIQLRRGTAAEWASVNPVLAQGEPGVETDTGKQKFGNGVAAWASLPYASAGPQGIPGVADDASVAAIIEDSGSETAGVLSATYIPRGLTQVGLDTDGVPYFSDALEFTEAVPLLTDVDGVPYFGA